MVLMFRMRVWVGGKTALTNIEALKRTIRSLQEEVCELRAEAATKRTSTSNRLKEIQAENASLKAQLEYHTANARWTSDDINHLQSELAAKTSQLQALQTDLHETQADLKFLQVRGFRSLPLSDPLWRSFSRDMFAGRWGQRDSASSCSFGSSIDCQSFQHEDGV